MQVINSEIVHNFSKQTKIAMAITIIIIIYHYHHQFGITIVIIMSSSSLLLSQKYRRYNEEIQIHI